VFTKGKSGNPLGRAIEKPFANALREEIAAAGDDNVELRAIAKNLLRIAKIQEGTTALPAISELANRLDGRPATEAVVTLQKHAASDWTRAELVQFLQDASRQADEVQARELKVIEAKPIAAIGVIPKRAGTH
jgi:hypothetical protein